MPSAEDYIQEEIKKQGQSQVDDFMNRMGPPLDKAYPKKASGKPNKMFYKAKPEK